MAALDLKCSVCGAQLILHSASRYRRHETLSAVARSNGWGLHDGRWACGEACRASAARDVTPVVIALDVPVPPPPAYRPPCPGEATGYGASFSRDLGVWVIYWMPGSVPLGATAETREACEFILGALRAQLR